MKLQTTPKNTPPVAPQKNALPDLEKTLEFLRLQQATRRVQARLRLAETSNFNLGTMQA